MAGLMQRASLVVKAKFSKLLNRAENPTETLDYSYEQMLQQLQNVKRGVADVVTAKKRLELQTQSIEQNVVKLETQARQAVTATWGRPCAPGARAQGRRAAAAPGGSTGRQQLADQQEKPHRLAAAAPGPHRADPVAEGSDQGAVLRSRGAGHYRRLRPASGAARKTRAWRSGAPATRPEELQARASAIDDLTASGALAKTSATTARSSDRETSRRSQRRVRPTTSSRSWKAEVGPGRPGEGDRARLEDLSGSQQRLVRPQEAEGAGA